MPQVEERDAPNVVEPIKHDEITYHLRPPEADASVTDFQRLLIPSQPMPFLIPTSKNIK